MEEMIVAEVLMFSSRGHYHHPRRGTQQLWGDAVAVVVHEDDTAGVWGGIRWRERRRRWE
jgi:hypothetical protein